MHSVLLNLELNCDIQELASHGHTATLIPVLSFAFVSTNTLTDKVMFNLHCFNNLLYVLIII